MCPTAQPGADLVQLDVWQVEMLEPAAVQRRAMLTGPGQPGGDGRVAMAEHPHRSGDIQPFGECRQHFRHPLGRGFEPVQRRITAGTEGRTTGLAVLPLSVVDNSGGLQGARDDRQEKVPGTRSPDHRRGSPLVFELQVFAH